MKGVASGVTVAVCTAPSPGAVAVLQLSGGLALQALAQLTGRTAWPVGVVHCCRLADIDEGVAVLLRDGADGRLPLVQIMPHGGLQVMRLLLARLRLLGCREEGEGAPSEHWPEAADGLEATLLETLAGAASPLALDALVAEAQGRLVLTANQRRNLISPPMVAVIGRPNAGKSTLLNRLTGRASAIVSAAAGTTRDWVAQVVELAPDGHPAHGVAVEWFDTPGLRDTEDGVEREAIALARKRAAGAQVLVALRESAGLWPEPADLPRRPDLWVVNKCEGRTAQPGDGRMPECPLPISAATGEGLAGLEQAVLAQLELWPLPV